MNYRPCATNAEFKNRESPTATTKSKWVDFMSISRFTHSQRESLWAWCMITPSLLLLLVFLWGPLIYVFLLSLYDWDLLTDKRFVGLSNFEAILHDPKFYHSLWVTVQYILISLPATVLFSMVLAIALNRVKFAVLFRTIYFLPNVSMTVAISLVWLLIYNPQFGFMNIILKFFGLPPLNWIFDAKWAIFSIALMGIWGHVGYNSIFYLAALQNIPKHLYESAEIDGATGWKKILYITVPLVSPTTFFLLIVGLIGSFQAFDQFYIMTQGGPGNATTSLVYLIYQTGLKSFRVGYASTLSVILFLIIISVTIIQFILQRKWVYYER
jgi:multiple sugar transport system permease protein